MKRLFLFIALCACVACSPRVTSQINSPYEPLSEGDEVKVLQSAAQLPEDAESLGTVAVKETGFVLPKNGIYSVVVGKAQDVARKAGGNMLVITEHRAPDNISSIHRIKAEVYRSSSGEALEYIPQYAMPDYQYEDQEVERIQKAPNQFVVDIYGGGGWRTSQIASSAAAYKDHLSALKWGIGYGADMIYYIHGLWGVGLRYSSLRSHHLGKNLPFQDTDGATQRGDIDTRTNIWFLGPEISWRGGPEMGKFSLFCSYGVGYMALKQVDEIPSYYPVTSKGATLGGFLEFGADFALTDQVFFVVSLADYFGSLDSYRESSHGRTQTVSLAEEEREGMGYLSLHIGLRWYFGKR